MGLRSGAHLSTRALRSPNTGRFWTRDTHEGNRNDPLSLHKYLFAHADPVNRIDPSGNVDFSLGSLTASISKAAGLAANIAWRVAPLGNRVTIIMYESVSGRTFVGGAGLLVGGKFTMTIVGGVTKVIDPLAKAHAENRVGGIQGGWQIWRVATQSVESDCSCS